MKQEPKVEDKGWDSLIEEKVEEFSTNFTNGIHVVDKKGGCFKSSSVQDWLRTALTEARKEAAQEQWEKDSKALEPLLTYCKEHNGMSYCKNCGLDANTLQAPQITNNDN